MIRGKFIKLLDSLQQEEMALSNTKGRDYAGEEDALSNFKVEATNIGIDPVQVWYVFFSKHLRALQTFIKTGEVSSEGIRSRVQDMRLYLALFLALVSDEHKIDIWTDETEEYERA